MIECNWNGETCLSVLSMTPVTQPNDVVTISGRPTGYINTATTIVGFNNLAMNYIPPSLFSVFTKLSDINIMKCSTTNLVTDNQGSDTQ